MFFNYYFQLIFKKIIKREKKLALEYLQSNGIKSIQVITRIFIIFFKLVDSINF